MDIESIISWEQLRDGRIPIEEEFPHETLGDEGLSYGQEHSLEFR